MTKDILCAHPDGVDNAAPQNIPTVESSVIIHDELGLHARPAAKLAQVAQQFEAEITLVHGELAADAKSILDVLSLAATRGSVLTLRCKGQDAPSATQALTLLFQNALISGGA